MSNEVNPVAEHYYDGHETLANVIGRALMQSGKDLAELKPADLATVDEFHIGGRQATIDIGSKIGLSEESQVLDVGSGLGGPARTLAEAYGCHVTGIDLTKAFCDAATTMSEWVGLNDKVDFVQGDATKLPFDDASFDSVISMHTAMNIEAKDKMFEEAKRVLKPNGTFVIYDVLQGEGGEVLYPVPWAKEPSISFLATPDEMHDMLTAAGFAITETNDTSADSLAWFKKLAERMAQDGPPPVTFAVFLGDDFRSMAANQVRNLAEKRIVTVSYICTP